MASQLCWAAAGPGVPDLRGRFAVVTGANRGIGKGVALGLGEAQATVFVTGRKRTDGGFLGKWLAAVPISHSNEGEVNLTTIGNWKWVIVMATELLVQKFQHISTLHLVGTGFDGNPGCEKRRRSRCHTQFSHSADTSKFSDMAQSNRQRNEDHVCKSKLFGL